MQHETDYKGLSIRACVPADHPRIIAVMDEWWGGRKLTHAVPRIFLEHFCNTSIVLEKDGELAAFLIGFFSQAHEDAGYIHFAGVHPEFRNLGVGRYMWDWFAATCKESGRRRVLSCTSPVNKDSINFHQKVGFIVLPGDKEVDGVQFTSDYNRPGDDKVLFERRL